MAYCDGCATRDRHVDSLKAEIARLRALVEKRERQIVWLTRRRPRIVWDDRGHLLVVEDDTVSGIVFDGTDSGLLAAVDEAMGE